jgi:hypothetical protein
MLAGFGIMELQHILASLHNAVIAPEANDVIAMEDKVSDPAWFLFILLLLFHPVVTILAVSGCFTYPSSSRT